jgi:hypothetical protein
MLWNLDRSRVATATGILLIAFASSIAATLGALTDDSLQSILPAMRAASVQHVLSGSGVPPLAPRERVK